MAIDKFVFWPMLLPVASAIPIKVSNSKRPSHFARSSLQLGPSCIFRRTAQPSVVCGALSRVRPRSRIAGGVAKRSAHAGVRGAQMMKVRAAPGDVETIAASCPDKRRSSLTTIALAYVTASALLTNAILCRCPAFAKHADANVERLVAADPPRAALLNNSQ